MFSSEIIFYVNVFSFMFCVYLYEGSQPVMLVPYQCIAALVTRRRGRLGTDCMSSMYTVATVLKNERMNDWSIRRLDDTNTPVTAI